MKDISLRQASIVTGIALLLMAIVAPIALNIYPKMIVSGDGAETINNIIANERSFRLGIIGLLVVAILDVLAGSLVQGGLCRNTRRRPESPFNCTCFA